MKTQIITLFTALVLAAGTTSTTFAATANKDDVTVLNDVSNINKIEVRGNVLLYISDGNADQVKVYNKYYAESALVKSRNGVLSIASYKKEQLVVWVKASDLSAVAAYDNAEVKTFGDVSKIEFNVELHDSASAQLTFDAISANVTVADNAKLDLKGSATEFSLIHSYSSTVNRSEFAADKVSEKRNGAPAIVKNDDLTSLF